MAQTGQVKFFNSEKVSDLSSLMMAVQTFLSISLPYRLQVWLDWPTTRRFPTRLNRIVAAKVQRL